MKTRLSIAAGLLSVLLIGSYWAYDASKLYIYRAGDAGSYTYNLLFDSAVMAIPIAVFLGILFGTFKGNEGTVSITNGKVLRHDEEMFLKHWSHTVGTLILIITGIRLGTIFIPRTMSSTETVGFALNMHFIGIIFFLFGVFYYITNGMLTGELKEMFPKKGDIEGAIGHYKSMLFGSEAPKEEKFMAIERVIFPFWILGISGITISGAIKVAAHIWSLPGVLMGITTFFHGVFTIFMTLMVTAHVFAGSILPASWPLIKSMITGYVTEDYVKHHHGKWYEEILNNQAREEKIRKRVLVQEQRSNSEEISA